MDVSAVGLLQFGGVIRTTSDLLNYLPLTREKTDLVRAYFADLIASMC